MSVPRKPGYYATAGAEWATATYGFPANPVKGDKHVASDGSRWEFNVHGRDVWDLMNYSPECASPGCATLTDNDYCESCLRHGHHLGVHF